jgi:serine kinase of HPr protein (carbohydrate metabolism regulator)
MDTLISNIIRDFCSIAFTAMFGIVAYWAKKYIDTKVKLDKELKDKQIELLNEQIQDIKLQRDNNK